MQHLEQLIYYGAEINAQNGSGNTPLHICSLYNQVGADENPRKKERLGGKAKYSHSIGNEQ